VGAGRPHAVRGQAVHLLDLANLVLVPDEHPVRPALEQPLVREQVPARDANSRGDAEPGRALHELDLLRRLLEDTGDEHDVGRLGAEKVVDAFAGRDRVLERGPGADHAAPVAGVTRRQGFLRRPQRHAAADRLQLAGLAQPAEHALLHPLPQRRARGVARVGVARDVDRAADEPGGVPPAVELAPLRCETVGDGGVLGGERLDQPARGRVGLARQRQVNRVPALGEPR
jgi:hypothetical protein